MGSRSATHIAFINFNTTNEIFRIVACLSFIRKAGAKCIAKFPKSTMTTVFQMLLAITFINFMSKFSKMFATTDRYHSDRLQLSRYSTLIISLLEASTSFNP